MDQVQEVLPHLSRVVIEQDLRRTVNPLLTIENLLHTQRPEEDQDPPDNPELAGPSTSQLSEESDVISDVRRDNDVQRREDDLSIRRRRLLEAAERRQVEFPPVP